VTLIVRARFVGMGSALEEASFDLGAPPLSTFARSRCRACTPQSWRR